MRRTVPLMIITLALAACQGAGDGGSPHAKGNAMSDHSGSPTPPPGKNRLAFEKSPYLLQHAENPVDWYPWGEEAFALAASENKPVFLSIGYSTCHWCHVMEHESFEDEQVAALLNETFVCIKVDREERPDIDNIYMTVCQLMTGSGGWPLTVLLTPDRKPFFAGTYLPKTAMLNFIPQVKDLWEREHERVVDEAGRITESLQQAMRGESGDELGAAELDLAYNQLVARFDNTYGGFGSAPKFPTPHNLMYLLRRWKRSGDPQALEMVEKTLQRMRRGGMYDHVGFGFHRYSTDHKWFLPHFEKMLYDQALLLMAYVEAYQATGNEAYRRTAEEIITYVSRDMTDERGGFYSAEDADSEGEEGKFYLWSASEIRELLGDDAATFIEIFAVEEDGNYAEEASGHRPGTNILHLEKPLEEHAAALGTDVDTLRDRLEDMRRKLFEVRERRVHPYKDDKVLTDWNGLMIAALAKAARAFHADEPLALARNAAKFVMTELAGDNGALLHRYRDGTASIVGMCDDYAFFVWGLLELYETTYDVAYLRRAIDYTAYLNEQFWDDEHGGYHFSADEGERLIVRQKEIYDGAVPSANSVAMLNLLRLSRMTGETEYEERARAVGRAFQKQVSAAPAVYTQLMCALDFAVGPSVEVVIVSRSDQDAQAMTRAIEARFIPNKVVLRKGESSDDAVAELAPFTKEQRTVGGEPTAYVCRNFACELPTTDVDEMLQLIDGK